MSASRTKARRIAPLLARNPHPTKKGPGRRHGQGVPHGFVEKPLTGAWAGPRTNEARHAERALVKELGKRQARIAVKAKRAAAARLT